MSETRTTTETTYHASIDGGEGGDTTFQTTSLKEALVQAIAWAKEGDWPEEGCEIAVRVWTEDEDGEVDEEDERTVRITSAAEKEDDRVSEGGEVIAEREGEWSTEQVVVIDGEAFYRHPNGGKCGAHNRQDGDGVWRERPCEPTRAISRTEARRLMLDWGHDPEEVAEATRGIEE